MGFHRVDPDESVNHCCVQCPDWFNDAERRYPVSVDECAYHCLHSRRCVEKLFRILIARLRKPSVRRGGRVTYRVLLPAAKNGLLAAVLLGAARSIGETMAVLMATGHSVNIPSSPLSWIRTLTATIAAELGEVARGGEHYQVLFIIGILLFTITFVVNLIADLVIKRHPTTIGTTLSNKF